jgi:hypothetical protein
MSMVGKKVRCINDDGFQASGLIREDEIYTVIGEQARTAGPGGSIDPSYQLQGQDQRYWFHASRFEEVSDIVFVKCIDNSELRSGELTEGKIYQVIEDDGDRRYEIRNDRGVCDTYYKSRFEVVNAPSLLDTVRNIQAATKVSDDPEEDRVRSLLTRPCHAENCVKCNAPLPCDYHS